MEAAVRLVNASAALNRHFLTKTTANHFLRFPRNDVVVRVSGTCIRASSSVTANPINFLPLSSNKLFNHSHSQPPANHFGPNDAGFAWHRPPSNVINGENASIFDHRETAVTVVLLGWLGARRKHLRRYVEWYNSRGINAITFVVEAKELLSFDLGRGVEKRIADLSNEIVSWVSHEEQDGKQRCLIFHTFSNTGWFVCGSILASLQGREDLMQKIKGLIVDSGGAGAFDPKVWAGGFGAAILKKRSSSAYSTVEDGKINGLEGQVSVSMMQDKEPDIIETMLLSLLEKLFSYIINLPDVNQRIKKVVSAVTNNPPACPHLYLYSTGDKVIPYQSVELLIEEQRKTGRKVFSVNFGPSAHVDHFRTFPSRYLSELHNFLKECFATVKKT